MISSGFNFSLIFLPTSFAKCSAESGVCSTWFFGTINVCPGFRGFSSSIAMFWALLAYFIRIGFASDDGAKDALSSEVDKFVLC